MERCSKQVYGVDSFWWHRCPRNGKVLRNGKPYCKLHDPVEVEASNKARTDRWNAEWDKKERRNKEAKAKQSRLKRKAALADELAAVLTNVQQDVNWMCNNQKLLERNVFNYLDSALAKWEEEEVEGR